MTGKKSTIRALYLNAAIKSPCSNECNTRWLPHPGHLYPVTSKNGHLGNNEDSKGSKTKYTPMPDIMTNAKTTITTYLRIMITAWPI